ncbi:MAG: type II secretion system protein GspE [Nitrospirae bacterium GWC2_57_9]|nr:MAG: type II secretion system protein GspE [Nitrospirae bacterium GWC2_57_9]
MRRLIGEILVESGLSPERLKKALDLQKKRGGRIGTLLIRLNFVSEDELLKALGVQLGLPVLADFGEIDRELALKLPITYAKKAVVLPLRRENGTVLAATAEPLSLATVDDLRVLFHADIALGLASGEKILDTVNRLHSEEMNKAEDTVQQMEDDDLSFLAAELEEPTDLLEVTDDAPIIRLVNSLLSQAIRERASDIHIEPFEKDLVARFRIDGILYNILTIQKRYQASIASRVKIMSGLNIAEKRLPQDGGMRIKIGGKDVDVRVSIVPISFGERIVLRLLYRESAMLPLEQIGFSRGNLDHFNQLITRPHGIILVTGPTGSGKTTTLYASLSKINSPDKNIITIEDPIEYQLKGIGQIQVNAKINLTFAAGLRSVLRQDPDVILVGEIRDGETAEIAIQAALTGHLVFSTLHTNDAAGAVTRLIDMKIEPFLISSSVMAILAQRLVRVLCKECREPYEITPAEMEELELNTSTGATVYRARGCENCFNTGYLGRKAIYELLLVDDEIRQLIMKNTDAATIRAAAMQRGMRTLRQDGADNVLQGVTSIEEVVRVTQREV